MTKRYVSERYAISAAKQRQWWFNMTPEERAEYDRKRAEGIARQKAGAQRRAGLKADHDAEGNNG